MRLLAGWWDSRWEKWTILRRPVKGLGNFPRKRLKFRNRIEEVFQKLYIAYLDGLGYFWYDFRVKNACNTCQGLTAFTMSKLKALGEYEKNRHSYCNRAPKFRRLG
jgi:hypothetical protein